MIIDINLFWIVLFIVVAVALFLVHSGFNINLFVKKDEHIADKFFNKFPLVSPDFYNKSAKEQNAENNQEIHEQNIILENILKRLDALERKR